MSPQFDRVILTRPEAFVQSLPDFINQKTLLILQDRPAVFAKRCVRVVAFGTALGAGLGGYSFPVGLGQLGGNNSGWYGDDSIADNHDKCGQCLAEARLWRDISVPDRRQRYNGPVNALWYAGKSALRIFDDVHQRAEKNNQGQYDK